MPGCFSLLAVGRRRQKSAGRSRSGDQEGHSPRATAARETKKHAPPAYTASPASLPSIDAKSVSKDVKTIQDTVDSLSEDLRNFSLKMHGYAEIAFKEYKTHDLLADFMEKQGFKVTRHAYGLETAVEAVFEHGKGGRTVGFNSEMDALPGIGHACGHNLIAIAGIAAAVSTAKALKKADVPGKVVLLGTPAEEDIGGKIILIKRGAYKQMDVCLMAHPAPFGGMAPFLSISGVEVEFFGHGAHAAGAPWEAINALDAAVLAYNNISALRQQIRPNERVHGIIQGSERWVTNVVPDYAKLSFGIRAPLRADKDALRDRVIKCFEAAAEATGCKIKIKEAMAYSDLRNNSFLTSEFIEYMENEEGLEFPSDVPTVGSTDFGDVTYALPAIHPVYGIPTKPNGGNHTPAFADSAKTQKAHEETLKVAKGLAVSGWRIFVDEDFAAKVRKEWEDMDKK